MPEKIKRWPPRKSVPRVPIENLPQDAIVEYWQWTTARGWYLAPSTDRPVSLREAIAERRMHEVSIWKCSGHPVYGAADAGAIEAFRAGLPAEGEGGNPGKYSGESPEGLGGRQDVP